MVLTLEILAVVLNFISFVLGLFIVKRYENVFTRKDVPKGKFLCVDLIEIIYFAVVVSMLTNLLFLYLQIDWIVNDYGKTLPSMIYSKLTLYHVGTGISVSLLHLTIHWFLKNKYYLNNNNRVKTNWKL